MNTAGPWSPFILKPRTAFGKAVAALRCRSGYALVAALCLMLVLAGCTPQSDGSRGILSVEHWQYRYGDSPRLDDGTFAWTAVQPDEHWRTAPVTINPPGRNGHEYLWLRGKLPADSPGRVALYLPRYIIRAYEVYLGPRLIYRHVNAFSPAPDAFRYFSWEIIELPDNYAGQYLSLRIYSDLVNIGLIDDVAVGRADDLVSRIVRKDLPFMLFALLFFSFFLLSLSIYIINTARRAFLGFSLLCLVFTMHVISTSFIQQLFIGYRELWNYTTMSYPFIFSLGLFMFLREILDRKNTRYFNAIIVMIISATLASAAAVVLGHLRFIYAPLPIVAVFILSTPWLIYVLAVESRNKNREARLVLLGVCVLVSFFIFESIRATFCIGPEIKQLFPLGVFFFLLPFVRILVRQYVRTYRNLEEHEREMAIARSIQQSILPKVKPSLGDFGIGIVYRPLEQVGGDFYDFHIADSRHIGVLVADVSGHGVPAALIGSMIKVAFAQSKELMRDPQRLMAHMAEILGEQVDQHFLTACYVYLDRDAGVLVTANAGHLPLIVYRSRDRRLHEIKPAGIMISPLPCPVYEASTLAIAPGDRIILLTDGIIEIANARNELFGMERFLPLVEEFSDLDAASFTRALMTRLSSWRAPGGSYDDDVTMIVLDVR